jgi:hypothetical protein
LNGVSCCIGYSDGGVMEQFCDVPSFPADIGETDPFVPGWRDLEQVCGVGSLWVCEALYPLLCNIWSIIPL